MTLVTFVSPILDKPTSDTLTLTLKTQLGQREGDRSIQIQSLRSNVKKVLDELEDTCHVELFLPLQLKLWSR